MPYYRSEGRLPHKRHTQFRDDAGALYKEEMVTAQGFAGNYALLYHINAPTEVRAIEPLADRPLQPLADASHRNRALNTAALRASGDVLDSRQVLFFNQRLVVATATPDRDTEAFYRNGLADELVYVATGHGTLATQWGEIAYQPHDMLVIPRSTTQQWRHDPGEQRFYILESRDPIAPCRRYRNADGQFSEHSPVCERDIKAPVLGPADASRGDFPVRVRMGQRLDLYHLAWHPFGVVGWDGALYPYAINMADFEPMTRRIHTMPDDHQLFETAGAAICCFVPRLLDYHPDAVIAPPIHSSVDVDEIVIHTTDTEFFGWQVPGPGLTTFHPRGLPHGPKPGAVEASLNVRKADGMALMFDIFDPLTLAAAVGDCEDPNYPMVWRTRDD